MLVQMSVVNRQLQNIHSLIDILFIKKLPTSMHELPSQNGIYMHVSQWNERGYLLLACF